MSLVIRLLTVQSRGSVLSVLDQCIFISHKLSFMYWWEWSPEICFSFIHWVIPDGYCLSMVALFLLYSKYRVLFELTLCRIPCNFHFILAVSNKNWNNLYWYKHWLDRLSSYRLNYHIADHVSIYRLVNKLSLFWIQHHFRRLHAMRVKALVFIRFKANLLHEIQIFFCLCTAYPIYFIRVKIAKRVCVLFIILCLSLPFVK